MKRFKEFMDLFPHIYRYDIHFGHISQIKLIYPEYRVYKK